MVGHRCLVSLLIDGLCQMMIYHSINGCINLIGFIDLGQSTYGCYRFSVSLLV